MRSDPETLMKEYVAACYRWNPSEIERFFADTFVFDFPGTSFLAGRHEGKRAIIDLTDQLTSVADCEEFTVLDLLAGRHCAAVCVNERYRRGEKRIEVRRVAFYHIEKGSFAAGHTHIDELETFDALLS